MLRRGFLALGAFCALLVSGGGPKTAEAQGRRRLRRPAPPKVQHEGTRAASRAARRWRAAPKPLIVIDPGHGGRDPGAIGGRGTLEKVVVLAVAQELRRALLASGRYRVALTREDDSFLALRARLAFARRTRPALLVSLHADSAPGARGASAYTLSMSAHSSAPSANTASSMRLARGAVSELGHVAALVADPHREAGFAVLRGSSTPSILVELGFLSHPGDEALLRQPGHRRGLARALARAVDDWFGGEDQQRLASGKMG